MKDITFSISGMSCGHCLNAVNRALSQVPGVEVESVQIGRARVRVSDAGDAARRARAAIEEAGYTVEAVEGLAE
ncbi:MAG TPA: heavy-metal-associated domain-containing protein [Gemmatimonadales bacterium]|jgi:copper chaperone CopZ|nr:heavy-metal-associated domain-containing protein [Gemmatimonadales bacterium]